MYVCVSHTLPLAFKNRNAYLHFLSTVCSVIKSNWYVDCFLYAKLGDSNDKAKYTFLGPLLTAFLYYTEKGAGIVYHCTKP